MIDKKFKMDEKEFKLEWENAIKPTGWVRVTTKNYDVTIIADNYRIGERKPKLVYLYLKGEYVGYIEFNSVYLVS